MGLRLDLGCGTNPHPGYIGVDIMAPNLWPGDSEGVYRVDLFQPHWPFKAASVEAIWCSHFVEHVPDLVGFMNECGRILDHGCEAVFVHPYAHSNRAWQDPTHVRALNEDSWRYYDRNQRTLMGVDHYPITCDFEVVNVDFVLAPEWQKQVVEQGWDLETPELRYAMRHAVNVVDDLVVTLRKR